MFDIMNFIQSPFGKIVVEEIGYDIVARIALDFAEKSQDEINDIADGLMPFIAKDIGKNIKKFYKFKIENESPEKKLEIEIKIKELEFLGKYRPSANHPIAKKYKNYCDSTNNNS